MKIELTSGEVAYVYDSLQREYSELRKETKKLIETLGPEKCKTDKVLKHAVLKQQDLFAIIDKLNKF